MVKRRNYNQYVGPLQQGLLLTAACMPRRQLFNVVGGMGLSLLATDLKRSCCILNVIAVVVVVDVDRWPQLKHSLLSACEVDACFLPAVDVLGSRADVVTVELTFSVPALAVCLIA